MKRCILFALIALAFSVTTGAKAVGQLGQAPEPAQNAAFLHKDSSLKIVGSGTITTTGIDLANPGAGVYASVTQTDFIQHSLGYRPLVMAFIDNSVTSLPLPFTSMSGTGSVASWNSVRLAVDEHNLLVIESVTVLGAIGYSPPQTIKYFLLENSAN